MVKKYSLKDNNMTSEASDCPIKSFPPKAAAIITLFHMLIDIFHRDTSIYV